MLWGVPRLWSSYVSAATGRASMLESFNASELARPNAITPIAAAPPTGRFPRRSRRLGLKRKFQAVFAVGQETRRSCCLCIQPTEILIN